MSQKEKIIADYVTGGMTTAEVAAKYGRSVKGLSVCLARWGATLPDGERIRRIKAAYEKRSCVSDGM